jgi:8-oxo-dGTP pyrophosphatase MutT (NUDIX family)
MGASILPVTIYKGKLYFLFGKERLTDENPGWSDFGGGTDNKESFLETAIREGGEELTGFLGSDKDVKQLLTKYGTFDIDYKSNGHGIYRVHIFPMEYDEHLPYYYNNNQRFLQKRLDPKIINDTKIFEKIEIKWICIDDIMKMKKEFRSFYQNIIELILARKEPLKKWCQNHLFSFTYKRKDRTNRSSVKQKSRKQLKKTMNFRRSKLYYK